MANSPLNRKVIGLEEIPHEWFQISTAYGIGLILRCWIPIIVLVSLCSAINAYWFWPFVILFIGVFQYHINIAAHSGQHWQIAKNRKLNNTLTRWLLSGPLVLPFREMQRSHLRHHSAIGTEYDADRWYYDLKAMSRDSVLGFNMWIVSLFFGATIFRHGGNILKKIYGQKIEESNSHSIDTSDYEGRPQFEKSDLYAISVSQSLLFVALWVLTGEVWAYVVFWVVPRFSVMTGLNAIRSSIEHADLNEPPHRLKSFRSNLVERFFIAPFNMNYHGEHHAYMTVPIQYLPKLRKLFLSSKHAPDFEIVPSYWSEYKKIMATMRKLEGIR